MTVLSSCNSTDIETDKTSNHKKIDNKKDEFKELFNNTNCIVFKLYDLSAESNLLQDLTKVIWTDSIKDLKAIKTFNNLFKSVENGGYYCCPKTHYTISFYKDNIKIKTYYVDTADIKNEVTVFGPSNQASYIITLKDFNSFIRRK